jgi:molybdopterin converting factor small subunit
MSVKIEIPSILGKYSKKKLNFEVEAKTVGEALRELGKQSPGLKKLLLDKEGNLTHFYDVYVNGETIYPQTMSRPVRDGDKLNIVMIIFGG